ncbi:MAG: J domain-containing protein, partial [Anaerolineae bacterium]|nr:J domain-containing protein [Anaerolineae bacterium]
MNDTSRNLYAILGISPEATADDIREAYRVMARRFHPDANHNQGADIQFRDIAAAYT